MPGTRDLHLHPMTTADHAAVVEILREIDPDDAAEAESSLKSEESKRFALDDGGKVIGLTGLTPIQETDHSAWLSWTAVRWDLATVEILSHLLGELVTKSQGAGYRKIFVSETAIPMPNRATYHKAFMTALHQVGFTEELRHEDYYQRREAAIFLGCHLGEPAASSPESADERAILITDSDEIAECDGSYYLEWEFTDGRGSSAKDLQKWLGKIGRWGGHLALISAPSDAAGVHPLAREGGFAEAGMLRDFYEDGIHEVHYSHYL